MWGEICMGKNIIKKDTKKIFYFIFILHILKIVILESSLVSCVFYELIML